MALRRPRWVSQARFAENPMETLKGNLFASINTFRFGCVLWHFLLKAALWGVAACLAGDVASQFKTWKNQVRRQHEPKQSKNFPQWYHPI
ncbi:hypothetical protein LSM04_005725 [Trypanosoma melophagium]|uniref:uncharacterized protein n=1 Tax=Trypanosoma melophagium TaxID=715481 RepID=UPI00351A277E|nr:hypothetical protein LSM04_005725 [Trypanosoma melophagium]